MNNNTQNMYDAQNVQRPFTVSEDDSLLFYSKEDELLAINKELLSIPKEDAQKEIDTLQSIVKKYNDEPLFAYYLVNAYYNANQKDIAEQLIRNNYQRFPLSLFARCTYATLCLDENRPTEALAAIEYSFDLEKIYPKRSVFHFTEIMAFYSFIVDYFCKIKDFNRAIHYIDTLSALTHPDIPLVLSMSDVVLMNILAQTLSPRHTSLILANCTKSIFKNIAAKSTAEKPAE